MAAVFASSSALLGGHLIHAILLGSWLPIFGFMVLADRSRTKPSLALSASRVRRADVRLTQMMAIGCVCAALVHSAVMPDHFRESWLYGTFFLAVGVGQILFAGALLVRPSRALIATGVAGSALIVGFWLASRLVGVPIGPDNGATERFGLLDILASAAESVTLIAGAVAVYRSASAPAWRLRAWAPQMRGLASVCIVGTLIASVLGPRS